MHKMQRSFIYKWSAVIFILAFLTGCGSNSQDVSELNVPRGYLQTIEIEMDDHLVKFGPFKGYYFKPDTVGNFSQLSVRCFNEDSFYTRDVPENALLFKGEAVLTTLEPADIPKEGEGRIYPVFFSEAPESWLQSRPAPQNEFIHFHSCHDASGPVLTGYWVRHRAMAAFTYDMGERVNEQSPLYHRVKPGIDKNFAKIIEFDRGRIR